MLARAKHQAKAAAFSVAEVTKQVKPSAGGNKRVEEWSQQGHGIR
jgi:hypothetical protein